MSTKGYIDIDITPTPPCEQTTIELSKLMDSQNTFLRTCEWTNLKSANPILNISGEANYFDYEISALQDLLRTLNLPPSAYTVSIYYEDAEEKNEDGCIMKVDIENGHIKSYQESRVIFEECEPDFDFEILGR